MVQIWRLPIHVNGLLGNYNKPSLLLMGLCFLRWKKIVLWGAKPLSIKLINNKIFTQITPLITLRSILALLIHQKNILIIFQWNYSLQQHPLWFNQQIIKDRFSIPLILMNELGDSTNKLWRKIFGYAIWANQCLYLLPSVDESCFPLFFVRRLLSSFLIDILIYSRILEDHMGHFITSKGVSTDPSKIQVVAGWPRPSNIKQLRGFLGLAEYCRHFALKKGLISTLMLSLLKFSKPFVKETNAFSSGINIVLMQDKYPIAYISKDLESKQ
ncbi:putative mitochondrial protein, partial [Mucuna pruriens]